MIGAFNNHFEQICINLIPMKKIFVLGLSGGMDSMALLYLLKNFLDNNKSFEIEIFPQNVVEWWFVPLKTGTFDDLFCKVFDEKSRKTHKEMGMVGTIIIE